MKSKAKTTSIILVFVAVTMAGYFTGCSSRQPLKSEAPTEVERTKIKALEDREKFRAQMEEVQAKFREDMGIERQNRIDELMKNSEAYQKQQRYEAALGQLESLLALDPQHDEALVMKDTLKDMIYFREQLNRELALL